MRVVSFDIETKGFNPRTPSDVHCLVMLDNGQDCGLMSFADQPGYPPIIDGVAHLYQAAHDAAILVAHNGLSFDLRRLNRCFDITIPHVNFFDTLIAARLLHPDTRVEDELKDLPLPLRGKHSLQAWGYRLGILKGDFGKTANWAHWTPEMQAYCETDVIVTTALFLRLADEQEAA